MVKMAIHENVISVDLPTWYCMRQCRDVNKYLIAQRNPVYDVEIKGNQEIFDHFMDEILNRKKAA